MPLAPDTKLGPYEVLAPIGVVGMGEVYRATDTSLGREVALKAADPTYVGNWKLNQCLALLAYEVAAEPELWPRFLELYNDAVSSDVTLLQVHDLGLNSQGVTKDRKAIQKGKFLRF